MEAVAKTKYLKGSPQKARLVIDLVRGKNVSKALAILKFTNKRAAGPIAKCLNSAIANATYKAEQDNIAIDPDDLWIKKCFVDIGPTKNRRRLRPAPQGRAYFERRHFCHITIEVSSEDMPQEEEKIFEKRGKKVMAKKASGDTKAKSEAKAKKDKKAEEVKEAKAETEKVEETVVESVEEEPKVEATTETEDAKVEEKIEVKEDATVEVTETEEAADEKSDDTKEEK